MINNNFFINVGQKDIAKKSESHNSSKDINYNDSWNRDVDNTHKNKTHKETNPKDDYKDFNKMLNHQRDKRYNFSENTNSELDNNKVNYVDTSNENKTSNVESSIEKVDEIINNDENFQGNKIEGEALQEIVALLNQIINSPEIKSLMPVKLEDPMQISNKNINKDNVLDILKAIKLGINTDNTNNAQISGGIGKENNLDSSLEVLKNINNSNEALNLANTILEILNSKNVEGVLPGKDVDGIKKVLEGVVDKIFKSDMSLLNNEVYEKATTSKDFKLSEKLKSHDKLETTKEDIRNISQEVDTNYNGTESTIMNSKASETKESLNNLNKILEILDSESISGVLDSEVVGEIISSKNTEETLISDDANGNLDFKNVNLPNNDFEGFVGNEIKNNTNLINNKIETVNKDISLRSVEDINNMLNKLKLGLSDDGNTIISSSVVSELEAILKTTQVDLNNNEMKKALIDLKSVVKSLMNSENIIIDDIESIETKNIPSELSYKLDSTANPNEKISEANNNISIDKVSEDKPFEKEDKVLMKILRENEIVAGGLSKQGNLITKLEIKAPDIIKEPMVVNKETMDVDIIKNVKFMMKNQVSELKVKIYPKELGEMTIKLLSEEGILKAEIKAVSKETYNLLNSNINDIKKSLEQQNIKIHEVNIELYNNDTTYHSGEKSNEEMFKNNENNRNRQGKNSSNSSAFVNDDFEEEKNVYEDSSVNLLV